MGDSIVYLRAQARNPVKGSEGLVAWILALPDDGTRLYMSRGPGPPFGSPGPLTVAEAMAHARDTMGIEFEEWETHRGQPFFAPPRDAAPYAHRRPRVAVDEVGIHFQSDPTHDIVVRFDELDSISVARWQRADGGDYLEFYVNRISGVDFRFHNDERGYDDAMKELTSCLPGFFEPDIRQISDDEITLWRRDHSAAL